MKKDIQKTHWLQNPNKNYLGHWDLPNGKDVILTIKTASWEEVVDPITKNSESKRVIRFEEKYSWVKPLICNQINAQTILKSTGQRFMEDCTGMRIKVGVGQTKVKGEEVDCIRVRNVKQQFLEPKKLNQEQVKHIQELLNNTDKSAMDICSAYEVAGLSELKSVHYDKIVSRLISLQSNGLENEDN
jgi:hypothetical protein